jgi:hypothetical protein
MNESTNDARGCRFVTREASPHSRADGPGLAAIREQSAPP